MLNVIETFGGMVCALGFALVFLAGFAVMIARSYGASAGRSPLNRREMKQEHDTFTNEEILTYGVDVRSKHARNQIAFSKYASEHGMRPDQQINGFIAGMKDRRRVFPKTDPEIVDGEIVNPELGSGRNQKRLRG